MASEENGRDQTRFLLERYHAGDRAALEELIARNSEWLHQFVHKKLQGPVRRSAETGDIVNEVVIEVLEQVQPFVVPNREAFRALVGTMVVHRIYYRARHENAAKRDVKKKRELNRDTLLYLGDEKPAKCVTRPDEKAILNERVALIRLATELIDPKDRELLELREREDLNFRSLGERLGCTEDTARKRHGAAVRRLDRKAKELSGGTLPGL